MEHHDWQNIFVHWSVQNVQVEKLYTDWNQVTKIFFVHWLQSGDKNIFVHWLKSGDKYIFVIWLEQVIEHWLLQDAKDEKLYTDWSLDSISELYK